MQSDMPEADAGAEVLIVGGGSVGLTARALLARWGVRTLLVEKHRELSPFPRSRLIDVRTMEIFRQLELAERITAAAFAPEYGRIRFRGTLHAPGFASAAMIGVTGPVPESPVTGVVTSSCEVTGVVTSQDRLEPALLGAAASEVRFGVELLGLAEEFDDVAACSPIAAARRAPAFAPATYRPPTAPTPPCGNGWAPAPRAPARSAVSPPSSSTPTSATGPPGSVHLTSQGSFLPLYPEGGWARFTPTPEDPDAADRPGLVVRSLGADAKVDVLRVQRWAVNAFVAERFRHGRTLPAGDAVHAIPPAGGLGMNLGVAGRQRPHRALDAITPG